MSATILWQPTGGGKRLGVSSPSAFKETMESTFGAFPLTLGTGEVDKIRAMFNASRDQSYNELADAIEKHGEIRIWAEY